MHDGNILGMERSASDFGHLLTACLCVDARIHMDMANNNEKRRRYISLTALIVSHVSGSFFPLDAAVLVCAKMRVFLVQHTQKFRV